jgi:hypothetical protein
MITLSPEMSEQEALARINQIEKPEVIIAPIKEEVPAPYYSLGGIAYVKEGAFVGVAVPASEASEAEIIHSRKVWNRGGDYLPVIPFYEKRLERAVKRAGRIARALAETA